MAHVIDHPVNTVEPEVRTKSVSPAGELIKTNEPVAPEEEQAPKTYFGMRAGIALLVAIVIVAAIVAIAVSFAFFGQGSAKKTVAATPAVATQSNAVAPSPAKLSASDIKEMKARDDYATNLGKFLHAKMPAYKNVKIYADNWAGTKAPAKSPLADIKARAGDNLMLVFWSPDAGTARGLSDFAKSPAATEAINAGFAEFQFVDSDTYCYAEVVPVAGVHGVSCGLR